MDRWQVGEKKLSHYGVTRMESESSIVLPYHAYFELCQGFAHFVRVVRELVMGWTFQDIKFVVAKIERLAKSGQRIEVTKKT
jgi:hypothetical protein